MKCKAKTEKEMREVEAPWPKSRKELIEWIDSLTNRKHEYGTCVYAMSLAAVAAFHYVSRRLRVTGFQASCADMDIIRRTRRLKYFSITNYEDMLYPQMKHHFDKKISSSLFESLQADAAKKLREDGKVANLRVRDHWEKIVAGMVPFCFVIKDEV